MRHLVPKVGAPTRFCDEPDTTQTLEDLAQLRHREPRDPTQVDRIDAAVDDGQNLEDALVPSIENLQIQIDAIAQRFGKPNETGVGEVRFLFQERSEKPDHEERVTQCSFLEPANERFGHRPTRLSRGSQHLADQLVPSRETREARASSASRDHPPSRPERTSPAIGFACSSPIRTVATIPIGAAGKTPGQIAQRFPR